MTALLSKAQLNPMVDDVPLEMKISVITVVFNDLPGLHSTMASVMASGFSEYEHIIVNGSTKPEVEDYLATITDPRVRSISEQDEGIYDAMNKGLKIADGQYVVFINAGDELLPQCGDKVEFQLKRCNGMVGIGYCVESYKDLRWLRPGIGRERNVFSAPPHPATFYPAVFCRQNEYNLALEIKADGEFTSRALRDLGGRFIPVVVSKFELGGISSTYSLNSKLLQKFKEARGTKGILKVAMKIILWRLLPRPIFYSLLAKGKYTELLDECNVNDRLAKGEVVLEQRGA